MLFFILSPWHIVRCGGMLKILTAKRLGAIWKLQNLPPAFWSNTCVSAINTRAQRTRENIIHSFLFFLCHRHCHFSANVISAKFRCKQRRIARREKKERQTRCIANRIGSPTTLHTCRTCRNHFNYANAKTSKMTTPVMMMTEKKISKFVAPKKPIEFAAMPTEPELELIKPNT